VKLICSFSLTAKKTNQKKLHQFYVLAVTGPLPSAAAMLGAAQREANSSIPAFFALRPAPCLLF
jgi:hypothetical protein